MSTMGKRWGWFVPLLGVMLLLGQHTVESQEQSSIDPTKAAKIFEELQGWLLTAVDVNEVMVGPQWLLTPPWFQPWTWSLQATGRLEASREERLGYPISAAAVFQKRGRTREDAIRLTTVLLHYVDETPLVQLFQSGPIEVIGFGTPADLPPELVTSIQKALQGWVDEVQVYKYDPDEFALVFRKQVTRIISIDLPRGEKFSTSQPVFIAAAFRSALLSPEERSKPEAEQLIITRLVGLARRQIERLEQEPVGWRR